MPSKNRSTRFGARNPRPTVPTRFRSERTRYSAFADHTTVRSVPLTGVAVEFGVVRVSAVIVWPRTPRMVLSRDSGSRSSCANAPALEKLAFGTDGLLLDWLNGGPKPVPVVMLVSVLSE